MTSRSGICRVAVVGVATAMLAQASAQAQDAVDLAAAKKEGKVVWYTSTPIAQAQKIAGLFEAATGIKVELFRSGGSEVLRRFQQEAAAGRLNADVMTTSDPAASQQLAKKGTFVPFKPKHFDKIGDETKDKDGAFIAQRLNIMTIYLRGDKIAEADRPQTWADVLDARHKGKLVMTDPSFTALQLTVVGMISKERGWSFYEKLKANDIMIVRGNQQVSDNIKRAERLIAVGAVDSYAAEDRAAGHPIVTIYPSDGTYVIHSPTAVIKGGPNPNAAKALAEFMIGDEAQKVFPADGGYAARTDIAPPAGSPPVTSIKILPIDYEYLEKSSAAIKKKFNEVFQ
jgi:iron(III) transport system substrate-binding protein